MQNTIKTLAQLGDLYATLTSSIPGSVVSNLVLMILERVDPNEQKSYANKMKKLAIKGYESYNEDRKNGFHPNLGSPTKSDFVKYVSSCFEAKQVPTILGLQEIAKATLPEAEAIMEYLERYWSSDTEYITTTRILSCISEIKTLQEDYACFQSFSNEQISYLQNILMTLQDTVNKLNNSFTKYIDSLKPFKDVSGSPYDYTSEVVPFLGRTVELSKLEEFCHDSRKVLWWSITGDGGVGKSKLAYEFSKEMIEKGWKCVFLTKETFAKIASFPNWIYPRNLLLVIDDAAYYGKEIGKWLEALNSIDDSHMSKTRILLIERTKPQQQTSNSINFLYDLSAPWISEIQRGIDDIDLLGHMCFDKTIIQLKPLDDVALHDIITGTINTYNGSVSEDIINQIIASLKQIDPDTKRPLYLLFLIQSWLDDPRQKFPSHFKELAEYIRKKELKRIQRIMGEGAPEECAEILILISTITHRFSFDDSDLLNISTIQKSIDQCCTPIYTKNTFRKNLQRLFGIVDNTCIITPLEPNLIGEYFVLHAFHNKPQLLKQIIQAAWQFSPLFTTKFLERIITDFYEFSERCEYYGLADMNDGIFQRPIIDDEVTETYYADLLVDLSATTTDARNAMTAVVYLEKIYSKYPSSSEIWTCFAKALMNLTNKQIDIRTMVNSIGILRNIASRNNTPLSVKIELAKGLFNLGAHLANININITSLSIPIVEELESLWKENKVYEIGLRYIKGLYYLRLPFISVGKEELLIKISQLIEMYGITAETREIYIDTIHELQTIHSFPNDLSPNDESFV